MRISGEVRTRDVAHYRAPMPAIGERLARYGFALGAAAVTPADKQFARDVTRGRRPMKAFERFLDLAAKCPLGIKAEIIAVVRDALFHGSDEEAPAIATAFSQYVRAHHGTQVWEAQVFGSTPSRSQYEHGAQCYRVVAEAATECAKALDAVGKE